MTAKSSVNYMYISVLIVRGSIKTISKWGSFDNLLLQSGAETVISKWVNVYFKVGQRLFQSGAKCYFKVGQLFQNGAYKLSILR